MKVILHIGYHKTATTFLQEEIFTRMQQENPDTVDYYDTFDISIQPKKEITIISDENLDGGSYRLGCTREKQLAILDNLKKLYPNAYIIVGIRDPHRWLISAYKQYTLGYGHTTLQRYVNSIDKQVLDMDGYVEEVKKRFKNVYVFDFERFKINPIGVVDELCDFIGLPVPENINYGKRNPQLTDSQVFLIHLFDKLFPLKEFHFVLSVFIKLVRGDVKFGEWGRKV